MAVRWRGEGAQHQGARPYQEDSWALRTLADGTVFAVLADGMGGHVGGATASRLAVGGFVMAIESGRSLAEALDIRGTPGFVIGDEIVPGAVSLDELKHLIEAARHGK